MRLELERARLGAVAARVCQGRNHLTVVAPGVRGQVDNIRYL